MELVIAYNVDPDVRQNRSRGTNGRLAQRRLLSRNSGSSGGTDGRL